MAGRRDRTSIEKVTLVLSAFIALTALPSGFALAIRPDGSLIELPASVLAGSPFPDFRVPGLMLALVVGGSACAALHGIRGRRTWGPFSVLVAGTIQTGWIAGQVLLLGYLGFLQPLILAVGITLMILSAPLKANVIRR